MATILSLLILLALLSSTCAYYDDDTDDVIDDDDGRSNDPYASSSSTRWDSASLSIDCTTLGNDRKYVACDTAPGPVPVYVPYESAQNQRRTPRRGSGRRRPVKLNYDQNKRKSEQKQDDEKMQSEIISEALQAAASSAYGTRRVLNRSTSGVHHSNNVRLTTSKPSVRPSDRNSEHPRYIPLHEHKSGKFYNHPHQRGTTRKPDLPQRTPAVQRRSGPSPVTKMHPHPTMASPLPRRSDFLSDGNDESPPPRSSYRVTCANGYYRCFNVERCIHLSLRW